MRLELWRTFPKELLIPNLSSDVVCCSADSVKAIIGDRGEAAIIASDIEYKVYANPHWDVSFESSNNAIWFNLDQHEEYKMFLLLIKFAHEFWILEELLLLQWWDLYNFLFSYKWSIWDNYSLNLESSFLAFEKGSNRKRERHSIPFNLRKGPHWSNWSYNSFIDNEKITFYCEEWEFTIHKSEIIHYLKLLILSWKHSAVCTPSQRYKYIIDFLFSDWYNELLNEYKDFL